MGGRKEAGGRQGGNRGTVVTRLLLGLAGVPSAIFLHAPAMMLWLALFASGGVGGSTAPATRPATARARSPDARRRAGGPSTSAGRSSGPPISSGLRVPAAPPVHAAHLLPASPGVPIGRRERDLKPYAAGRCLPLTTRHAVGG